MEDSPTEIADDDTDDESDDGLEDFFINYLANDEIPVIDFDEPQENFAVENVEADHNPQ